MKCKLTGEEGEGVRAHIIPRSFYNIDPEEKLPSKILTNVEGQYARRSHVGIYDSEIVTDQGERLFSPWDDYAKELLIDRRQEQTVMMRSGEAIGFEQKEFDFERLKLFFLSVLWRASVTSQPFFYGVNLGPHEAIIRDILLRSSVNDSDGYDVTIARWAGDPDSMGMLNPHSTRFDKIRYIQMYIYQYIVYIKVDKQNSNHIFDRIRMKFGQPLRIIGRDLESSKERNIMIKLVQE